MEGKTKSITFDKAAQDALPQHIKDKMKADREKALAEVINEPSKLPEVFTRTEVIQILEDLLQRPDVLTDAVLNEWTDYDAVCLLEMGCEEVDFSCPEILNALQEAVIGYEWKKETHPTLWDKSDDEHYEKCVKAINKAGGHDR